MTSDNVPQRRATDESSFKMDSVLLADQNQKLIQLTESVNKLAVAIGERPTRSDIAENHRKTIRRFTALVTIFIMVLSFLFVQNHKINQACQDRSANAAAFRKLLIVIDNQVMDSKINAAVREYQRSLETVNC